MLVSVSFSRVFAQCISHTRNPLAPTSFYADFVLFALPFSHFEAGPSLNAVQLYI